MGATEELSPTGGLDVGRVLLVIPDHWTRVLLRAELVERGFDAVGASSLKSARNVANNDERGPVRVILLDEGALSGDDNASVDALSSRHENAPIALLASAFAEPRVGPFRRIIRRPTSIGVLVSLVQELWKETSPSSARKNARASVFETRMGPPWPYVRCRVCSRSRHLEPLRTEPERQRGATEFRKFIREHASCMQEQQRRPAREPR
jgi:hypothetical protein